MFKDLLNYFNKSTLIINRWKIKALLESNYKSAFSNLIFKLKENIDNNGLFSLSLDIWTLNNQTAYFGIILAYIDI